MRAWSRFHEAHSVSVHGVVTTPAQIRSFVRTHRSRTRPRYTLPVYHTSNSSASTTCYLSESKSNLL